VAATFFLGFNKLAAPVILVSDRDEALRWLKGEVNEVVDWGGGGYGPESTRIQAVADSLEEMISGNFDIEHEVPRTMDEIDALSIGLSMLAEEISGLLAERDATELALRAHISDLEQLLADRAAKAECEERQPESGDGE
jgi:hypothetical protein